MHLRRLSNLLDVSTQLNSLHTPGPRRVTDMHPDPDGGPDLAYTPSFRVSPSRVNHCVDHDVVGSDLLLS